MAVNYFKRYRMEYDLSDRLFSRPPTPAGYELVGWSEHLLHDHARAKYLSFRGEIDSNVFTCLGTPDGCERLMSDISTRNIFCPEATWLVVYRPPGDEQPQPCGTIQGLFDRHGYGLIQNIGVAPDHRGLALGTLLIHAALCGFIERGMRKASLQVTAFNLGAIRLYQRLGFTTTKTVYKAVDVAYV